MDGDAAKNAEIRQELEHEMMNPNEPKTAREWWAVSEIERLRAENERLRELIERTVYHADMLLLDIPREMYVEFKQALSQGGEVPR